MRETFKDIEVGERKFRISKFDALTGSYIIYTLLTEILPMGIGSKIDGLEKENVNKNLPQMTKEKFTEIQKDCLKCCSEIRPEGNVVLPVPIMLKDGRWGVDDIQNDAPLAMLLTIHVLGYNAQSFFQGNALEMFQQSTAQFNLSNV
jgi:hypothetical protein